jgi:hypothetical protein
MARLRGNHLSICAFEYRRQLGSLESEVPNRRIIAERSLNSDTVMISQRVLRNPTFGPSGWVPRFTPWYVSTYAHSTNGSFSTKLGDAETNAGPRSPTIVRRGRTIPAVSKIFPQRLKPAPLCLLLRPG